ncbi:MAG: RagB/SusD family nutrient uptake outer membrane protein [Bacteroidales bacterium]|jgi:hypothetical protein|nr:RagB/SusD family nutrient uptake outer membrane protein [Bacteroidales bacterium]
MNFNTDKKQKSPFVGLKTLMAGLSCIVALSLASCDKWLDLRPYDGVVEDEYWNTKEDVYSALIGCYSSLLTQSLVTNMIYWGELRADILTGASSASTNVLDVVRGEITPENTIVKWDQFYKTINYCNKVIEKSELVKGKDKSFTDILYRRYYAEAVAIRSLMYFYLVRSFSDVPYVTVASNDDQQDYYLPKISGASILTQEAERLEACINDFETNFGRTDMNKGRITRWAALALLADIYLWQDNYAKCSEKCTEILNSGQFVLIPVGKTKQYISDESGVIVDTAYYPISGDRDALFEQLYVSGNSLESIFELQYPKSDEVLGNPFFSLMNSTSNRPVMIPNEEVLDASIFPPYELDGEVIDIRGRDFSYKTGFVSKWTNRSRTGSLRTQQEFPHWILYRLPDLILMKAEALTELGIKDGDTEKYKEAYSLVMRVRERANAVGAIDSTINGKALQRLILEERAREFAFEGKRWYDVLRFAKRDNFANRDYLMQLAITSAPPEKVASLQAKYANNWFAYWPIHVNVVEVNTNLEQNEFYK